MLLLLHLKGYQLVKALLQMVLLQLVQPEGCCWQQLLLVTVRVVCVQTHPVYCRHYGVVALMLHAAEQLRQPTWLVLAPHSGFSACVPPQLLPPV
jgi:hypothetical protein